MTNQLTLLEGISPNPEAKPRKLSARQLRAIRMYSLLEGCNVQLSAHPVYTFVEKESGREFKKHIKEVEDFYDQYRKEAAIAKRRKNA